MKNYSRSHEPFGAMCTCSVPQNPALVTQRPQSAHQSCPGFRYCVLRKPRPTEWGSSHSRRGKVGNLNGAAAHTSGTHLYLRICIMVHFWLRNMGLSGYLGGSESQRCLFEGFRRGRGFQEAGNRRVWHRGLEVGRGFRKLESPNQSLT